MQVMPSLLSDIVSQQKLPGINVPYLYIGGFGTMFCWHTEDFDMNSINFLHTGEPKIWYCLGRQEGHRLERWVKAKLPAEFLTCPQFMRHKTIMADPYRLVAEIPGLYIEK